MASIDSRGFYANYVNALNNHDLDRMEAFYSGSIRFQLYDMVQNFDELIEGLNDINGAFPDWRWEVLEVLFDGELITARYADTGTHGAFSRASSRRGGRCRPWSSRFIGSSTIGSLRCGLRWTSGM